MKRGAIAFTQDVDSELDRQIRADAEEVSVERRVMQTAQSQPVGKHRFAAGMTIRQDVRRVEQFSMTEPADRTLGLIGLQNPLTGMPAGAVAEASQRSHKHVVPRQPSARPRVLIRALAPVRRRQS